MVGVLALGVRLHNVIARRAAKHDKVQQRIGAQTVGAVYRSSGALADGVQTVDRCSFAIGNADHLAIDVGGNAAHLVVNGRSEERRVGKECVSTCRSRWSRYP